ncbi:hypothetical protein PGT21_019371 [Puccinia graminis f. sp. tritici]|uniref:Uncharacterized protein n=1 Tax=Puccinia graminis f. sp. tritici TaxID=56615 RepID=A0A5B0P7F7_PUCGR|nr:hypothetical protein PGT21_019371 [Puccinia graminis f. sp. tritici]KAA1131907.1 hypothetical protein PGTUg99_033302 [Puccinia graminis f. sp. tritici]
MLLINFFQAKYIGWALLPMITILYSGQVALVDGREVICMPHMDSEDNKPDVSCWLDKNTKFICPKTSCRSTKYPAVKFGDMLYQGCLNDVAQKYNRRVHPRNYHHYPKGDGKYEWGQNGFVSAFESASQLWYNCLYDGHDDNKDTYTCSDCKEAPKP